MGLPARQRRVLDHIDSSLRGSDPRLAALYAIFGRLTQGEEMPRIEQLRHGMLTWLVRLRAVPVALVSRRHFKLRPRQRIALFYPLAIALAIGSIVFAARSGPDRACVPVRAVAAAKNAAKSSLCRPPTTVRPLIFGH